MQLGRRARPSKAKNLTIHMKTALQTKPASCAVPEIQRPMPRYLTPEVNIFETSEGWVLEAEMPGVAKDGLEVTIEGRELTIIGHRKSDVPEGTALWRESNEADFRRLFELDPSVDASRIQAKMENGVLTLTLSKAEAVKPRRIEVTD
jgi:HSP20 family protein